VGKGEGRSKVTGGWVSSGEGGGEERGYGMEWDAMQLGRHKSRKLIFCHDQIV